MLSKLYETGGGLIHSWDSICVSHKQFQQMPQMQEILHFFWAFIKAKDQWTPNIYRRLVDHDYSELQPKAQRIRNIKALGIDKVRNLQ